MTALIGVEGWTYTTGDPPAELGQTLICSPHGRRLTARIRNLSLQLRPPGHVAVLVVVDRAPDEIHNGFDEDAARAHSR